MDRQGDQDDGRNSQEASGRKRTTKEQTEQNQSSQGRNDQLLITGKRIPSSAKCVYHRPDYIMLEQSDNN